MFRDCLKCFQIARQAIVGIQSIGSPSSSSTHSQFLVSIQCSLNSVSVRIFLVSGQFWLNFRPFSVLSHLMFGLFYAHSLTQPILSSISLNSQLFSVHFQLDNFPIILCAISFFSQSAHIFLVSVMFSAFVSVLALSQLHCQNLLFSFWHKQHKKEKTQSFSR